MANIKIAERLKPFSHIPGTACILPGSGYQVQIFPTLLRFHDLASSPKLLTEIQFDLQGPLQDFTVQNDLEKGELRIWGNAPAGFVRYSINSHKSGKGLRVHFEKTPVDGIHLIHENSAHKFFPNDSLTLFHAPFNGDEIFRPLSIDRLSLGNHKSQDWEQILRRRDLSEIFPVWQRLGQLIPTPKKQDEGAYALLHACREGMRLNQPEKLYQLWINLFMAGFHSLLAPRVWDDQFQGLITEQPKDMPWISPLGLLTEGANLIRELFIHSNHATINILPSLIPEFHAGRLIEVSLEGAKISLEWSKKTIRRLEFIPEIDQEWIFHFKHVKECRIRRNKSEKGGLVESGHPVILEKNSHYFFDNFK